MTLAELKEKAEKAEQRNIITVRRDTMFFRNAANPTTVLALIQSIEELEKALEEISQPLTCPAMEAANIDDPQSISTGYFDLNRLRRKIANEALSQHRARWK